jgi:hypothetical protein
MASIFEELYGFPAPRQAYQREAYGSPYTGPYPMGESVATLDQYFGTSSDPYVPYTSADRRDHYNPIMMENSPNFDWVGYPEAQTGYNMNTAVNNVQFGNMPFKPNLGEGSGNIDPRTFSPPFTDNMNAMNAYDDPSHGMTPISTDDPNMTVLDMVRDQSMGDDLNALTLQDHAVRNYQSPTLPPMPQQAQGQGSGWYPGMYAGQALGAGRNLFSGLFGGNNQVENPAWEGEGSNPWDSDPTNPDDPIWGNYAGGGDLGGTNSMATTVPTSNWMELGTGLRNMFTGAIEGGAPGAKQAGGAAWNLGKAGASKLGDVGGNLLSALGGENANPYLGALKAGGAIMGAIGEYKADQRGVDAYRGLADKAETRAGRYGDLAESYRTGDAINQAYALNKDTHMQGANKINTTLASQGVNSSAIMKQNILGATDKANIGNQAIKQQYSQYADKQESIYDSVMAQANQLDAQADMIDGKKWWEYGASAVNAIV